jgi:hypothetical protein
MAYEQFKRAKKKRQVGIYITSSRAQARLFKNDFARHCDDE